VMPPELQHAVSSWHEGPQKSYRARVSPNGTASLTATV
jgi:hypothetical protein